MIESGTMASWHEDNSLGFELRRLPEEGSSVLRRSKTIHESTRNDSN